MRADTSRCSQWFFRSLKSPTAITVFLSVRRETCRQVLKISQLLRLLIRDYWCANSSATPYQRLAPSDRDRGFESVERMMGFYSRLIPHRNSPIARGASLYGCAVWFPIKSYDKESVKNNCADDMLVFLIPSALAQIFSKPIINAAFVRGDQAVGTYPRSCQCIRARNGAHVRCEAWRTRGMSTLVRFADSGQTLCYFQELARNDIGKSPWTERFLQKHLTIPVQTQPM
jgi:hypothetical protein